MKKLFLGFQRIYNIMFCQHNKKIRFLSINSKLEYKICKACGLFIEEHK